MLTSKLMHQVMLALCFMREKTIIRAMTWTSVRYSDIIYPQRSVRFWVGFKLQDLLSCLNETEGHVSNIEDTVNSKKAKSDTLVKQLLKNKLEKLENHSPQSKIKVPEMKGRML